MANDRYILQIRYKDHSDENPLIYREWHEYETFKTLRECEDMAEGLMDNTVAKMQIVDKVKNEICKRYSLDEVGKR